MPLFNKRDQYGWMAVLLHWLLFFLIAGLVASGKYSHTLPSTGKNPMLIFWHSQIGIAVFALMSFRLLWRMINTSPEGFVDIYVIRALSFLGHWLLYLVVLGQALVGLCMMQLAGREMAFFGVALPVIANDVYNFLVPFLGVVGDNLSPAKQMRILHEWGGWAIIVLVGAHVAVSFCHHFILMDDTLRRMSFKYLPDYVRYDVRVQKMMQKNKEKN